MYSSAVSNLHNRGQVLASADPPDGPLAAAGVVPNGVAIAGECVCDPPALDQALPMFCDP